MRLEVDEQSAEQLDAQPHERVRLDHPHIQYSAVERRCTLSCKATASTE